MKTIVKASIAGLVLVVAGCATQKDLLATRAVADRAVQDAAAAKSAADAAMASARQAASAANVAQTTANQGVQASQASQACCDATNEKMNRMFEKAVRK